MLYFIVIFATESLDMKLFIISAVLLGLAFAGIAIKIWGKKEF